MRLRSRPKEPKRTKFEMSEWLGNWDTVQELVDYLKSKGIDPSEARIDIYYDECNLKYFLPETDAQFESRRKRYLERLAIYEDWYKENKKAIEDEIAKRKTEAEEKKRKEIEAARERAAKTLAKLDANLEKLNAP